MRQEEARKEIESELEALRERLAAIKAENEGVPETHDWNEDKTRKLIIDLDLERAGWRLDREQDREYEVTGMPTESGVGYADYVLWGDDGKPLAVVEAKKTTVDPEVGQQQAKLYADCLEAMHGQRPVIFYTNGYKTRLWDDLAYPPRNVAGFYKKDELASLIHRRAQRAPLDVAQVKDHIVERYYQKRAIGSIGEQFGQRRRKALLVMATGSGKTRVAVALVDLLQRAGWVKRALFLADRVALVNQAVGAFKAHLPESSPVNLVTEKDKAGRVYVCTYPTMMGLIDETTGTEARFGVGHFDLVIIDEAHRSVYQKYRAIFPALRLTTGRPDRNASGSGRPKHLRTLRLGAGRAHRRVRTRDRGGRRLSRTTEGSAGGPPVSARRHRLRLAQRGRAGTVGKPRLGR